MHDATAKTEYTAADVRRVEREAYVAIQHLCRITEETIKWRSEEERRTTAVRLPKISANLALIIGSRLSYNEKEDILNGIRSEYPFLFED